MNIWYYMAKGMNDVDKVGAGELVSRPYLDRLFWLAWVDPIPLVLKSRKVGQARGSQRCNMRTTWPAIAGFEDGEGKHPLRNVVSYKHWGQSLLYSQQRNTDLGPAT